MRAESNKDWLRGEMEWHGGNIFSYNDIDGSRPTTRALRPRSPCIDAPSGPEGRLRES
jgi:hypothetical protein